MILDSGFEPQYKPLVAHVGMNSTDADVCTPSREASKVALLLIFPGVLVVIFCAICYAKIFKYFRDSRKELHTLAAESNNSSPILSNNFKNLTLHILTISLLLGTQMLGSLVLSIRFLSSQNTMWVQLAGYFIYLVNSCINPWLTIGCIRDFNVAVTALSQCKSMRNYKRKQAIQNVVAKSLV